MLAKYIAILQRISPFFGAGSINKRIRKGNPTAIYTVQNNKYIVTKIVPHFEKFALITQKNADLLLFKSAVQVLTSIEARDLQLNDIRKILSYKASMGKNRGLFDKLNKLFPNIVKAVRQIIVANKIQSLFWLAGFACAEGIFNTKPINKGVLFAFSLVFTISQHISDIALLHLIK